MKKEFHHPDFPMWIVLQGVVYPEAFKVVSKVNQHPIFRSDIALMEKELISLGFQEKINQPEE